MPMTADTSPPSPHDPQGLWLALTASQLGAAHRVAGLPNQDAVATYQAKPDVVVAAVADGHGHQRHFRSARGSRLAVAVACEAAQELAARLDGFETAEQIESEALGKLVPAITGQWRAAVRHDLTSKPFTGEEEAERGAGDDALIAYGSTLLLAVAGRKWLVLAQIGDGDIVGIQPDGRPLLPVPGDLSLNGQQTTSLCASRAEQDFRIAVVNTAATAVLGVLLATDGYGNAQAADPWVDAVSADLADLIGDRSPEWLADQLPVWANRCASADGSADDTTIALLIAPSATGQRREAPVASVPGELPAAAARELADPTARVVPETPVTREQRLAKSVVPATVWSQAWDEGDAGVPGPASARRSRQLVLITGLVLVVVAALAVFAVTRLLAPPTTAHAGCPPSSATGQLVTGESTTVCDPSSGRMVQVSLSSLHGKKRVVLQAGRSVFVLVDNALWWRPISGGDNDWVDLGPVANGTQQSMCLVASSVVVTAKTGATWTEVKVPAASPVGMASPSPAATNVCAVGLSR